MATPAGKSILQSLGEFRVTKWYTKEFPKFVTKLIAAMQSKNEVTVGGLVAVPTTPATVSATIPLVDIAAALSCTLLGRVMAALTAPGADVNLLSGLGAPIFSDGTDASAKALVADETAFITLIATNSDGAGDADEADGGTVVIVPVFAGDAATEATEALSSTEVQAALEASAAVHDGVTGWAHLGAVEWADVGGAAWTIAVTANRNNVVLSA